MGRAPCCDKTKVKRGPWSPQEDTTLKNFLQKYGTGGNWISLPQKAGLTRCGKSCRLRWLNYLRPDIKHGGFTDEEDAIMLTLYHSIGSRWSVIASHLPGRTDNDVKNYWNTKLKKKFFASVNTSTISHVTATNNMTSNNLLHEANYYSGSSNNSINSSLDMVAAPAQLPGITEFPEILELNAYNYNFPLKYQEAVSSFSESSTCIDNTASSSHVVDLGSELMSFDHFLGAFDFEETNQSFVFSPYSILELDDAHLLYYN